MVSELKLTVSGAVAPSVVSPVSVSNSHSKESPPQANVNIVGGDVAASGKNPSSSKSSGSPVSQEDVLEAMHKMRDYMQVIDRDLHFSVDETSGLTVVKVVDPATDKVVRQIPSEEVMRVVHSLESGGGLLSNIKV